MGKETVLILWYKKSFQTKPKGKEKLGCRKGGKKTERGCDGEKTASIQQEGRGHNKGFGKTSTIECTSSTGGGKHKRKEPQRGKKIHRSITLAVDFWGELFGAGCIPIEKRFPRKTEKKKWEAPLTSRMRTLQKTVEAKPGTHFHKEGEIRKDSSLPGRLDPGATDEA